MCLLAYILTYMHQLQEPRIKKVAVQMYGKIGTQLEVVKESPTDRKFLREVRNVK